MNNDKQRIAIAEACGLGPYDFYDTQGERLYGSDMGRIGRTTIPDYLNDLNAIHEAEMPLGEFESTVYYDTLIYITGSQRDATFATAAQRSEAFLKTLNKWEEETCQAEQ